MRAAQLDAVDAGLGGGVVDQPLHEVVALGPAGAAIGADEAGVGEHALGRHLHQRRAVEADDVAHDVERRRLRRHGALEAAEIAVAGQPQRQEMAVRVERKLGGLLVVAAVVVGHEAGRALVGPLHRPAERARGMQDADVLRIDLRLHAERAADVAGDHVHLVGRDLQDVDQTGLQAHHALAARVQREPLVGGVVVADRRARLDRVDDHAGVEQLELDLVGGAARRPRSTLSAVAIVEIERRCCPARRRRAPARRRAAACCGVVTTGSGSMSTSIASAASLACSSVSATTQAIGSPTKRTLSVGSAGRGGFFRSEPSRLLNGSADCSVP